MTLPIAAEPTPNDPNEWTVMFFFASDNPLAPLIVSQLKAIKDAGFQEHSEVLVYFDPMERGYPTKIYNVNCKRKAYAKAKWEQNNEYSKSYIGDGNDPYVRNMAEDEVDPRTFSAEMQAAMADPSTLTAEKALSNFVDYGITNHRARNYMLFLVGHGMIVGRDTFLPDDDPVSAITLVQLQGIMEKFRENGKTSLHLLALHSCSMSSVEVAYQLRGTASYMMATQGPAFVNSWPYRQLLKKILNTIEKVKGGARKRARENNRNEGEVEEAVKNARVNVEKLVEKLYYLCLHNATDFLSAGYSADLTLCSLEQDKLSRIKDPLQNLVQKLKANLYRVSIIQDLIVLAHWESQSFWEENYTDLFDFCRCLSNGCNDRALALETLSPSEKCLIQELRGVRDACDKLTKVLDVIKSRKLSDRFNGLVIHEDNFGWKYQYARGLSIYFPWSEPLDDDPAPSAPKDARPGQPLPEGRSRSVIDMYRRYDFTTDFGAHSWWSFLEAYSESTKRLSRKDEEGDEMFAELLDVRFTSEGINHLFTRAERTFNSDGSLGTRTPEVGTRTPETGISCDCPSIKNYPTDLQRRVKKFSITPGALRAFRQDDDPDLFEEDPSEEDDAENEQDD